MCPRPADPFAHDALLDAARTEFALRGLEAARLEDITRRAGVSKGAFYLHFRSKDDAFREILERFFGILEELVHRHKEAEIESARVNGPLTHHDVASGSKRFQQELEVERACDEELLETLWRHRKILAILDSASGSSCIPMLERFRRRMADFVIHTEFGEKTAGCLRRDIDREVLGDLVLGAYESFARRMVHMRKKPDLRAWARTMLLVIWQGAVEPACDCANKGNDP